MTDKNVVQLPEESKVGKKLSDLTTKRIIVLVIILIIASMLFNANFYSDSQTSMSLGIAFFNFFPSVMDPDLLKAFSIYVDNHKVIIIKIRISQVLLYMLVLLTSLMVTIYISGSGILKK